MTSFRPLYQAYYCEENIWKLALEPSFLGPSFVCFLSNLEKSCAVWFQRASDNPQTPVFWDYHVIFLHQAPEGWEVWDLDSTLGYPQNAAFYLKQTFLLTDLLPEKHHPLFRLIPTPVFLDGFSSDRSHMRRKDGSYTHPPPPWPAPHIAGQTPTLPRLIDFRDDFLGEILDRKAMKERFA